MIIDAHTHIGTVQNFDMPKEALISSMEKYGIDISITSNCEAVEYDGNHKLLPYFMQTSQENAYQKSIDFARKYPGKIAVMPWVKPHTEGITNELISMIKRNLDVTVGIKVHPFHSFLNFNSPQVEEYIKTVETFNIPILVHTASSKESSCRSVYEMAVKYPKVNFIMGHMGLGTDNSEAVSLIKKQKNLYGDTAWVPVESTVRAIKECGADKIIFGTDNTIDGIDTLLKNKSGERSLYQQYFNDLKDILSKEEYDMLMYKNSIKLFNLQKITKS